MSVGERLAALRPDERRSELRLKEVVHQAAVEIAHEYLAEIAPHIGDLDIERAAANSPWERLKPRTGGKTLPGA